MHTGLPSLLRLLPGGFDADAAGVTAAEALLGVCSCAALCDAPQPAVAAVPVAACFATANRLILRSYGRLDSGTLGGCHGFTFCILPRCNAKSAKAKRRGSGGPSWPCRRSGKRGKRGRSDCNAQVECQSSVSVHHALHCAQTCQILICTANCRPSGKTDDRLFTTQQLQRASLGNTNRQ